MWPFVVVVGRICLTFVVFGVSRHLNFKHFSESLLRISEVLKVFYFLPGKKEKKEQHKPRGEILRKLFMLSIKASRGSLAAPLLSFMQKKLNFSRLHTPHTLYT